LAHQAEALLPKPSLETNHGKVVARLEREGWVPRHGGDHDVYKDPSSLAASLWHATEPCRWASPA
jgi:hypothetical protein